MGDGGAKGFISDAGGWAVNPMQKAFGDVGLWISDPVQGLLKQFDVEWANPVGAATSGYVQATREGRGQFQDLTNPLLFGQTGPDRMKAEDANKKAWDDYYAAMREDWRKPRTATTEGGSLLTDDEEGNNG